jgi:hypothetical protein
MSTFLDLEKVYSTYSFLAAQKLMYVSRRKKGWRRWRARLTLSLL